MYSLYLNVVINHAESDNDVFVILMGVLWVYIYFLGMLVDGLPAGLTRTECLVETLPTNYLVVNEK